MVDQNAGAIEHDTNRVAELSHNENLRVLKESKNDFLFDTEEAHQIFEQPILVFKKTEVVPVPLPEPEVPKKDPIDMFIEKLYNFMKSSKQFPNTLRELEKLIKKNIIKKGEQQQSQQQAVVDDIKLFAENVIRRMNEKAMFTKKKKTVGESKEHAKDHVKLKFADIIEVFKREDKEDIPIVFESSFAFNK